MGENIAQQVAVMLSGILFLLKCIIITILASSSSSKMVFMKILIKIYHD